MPDGSGCSDDRSERPDSAEGQHDCSAQCRSCRRDAGHEEYLRYREFPERLLLHDQCKHRTAQGCQTREVILAEGCATRATIRDEQDKTRALISQLDREQLLRESAAKDAKIAQLEAFQFNTALAAGNAQQTRNEMQGQTALILAALRDRTPASSGGASA